MALPLFLAVIPVFFSRIRWTRWKYFIYDTIPPCLFYYTSHPNSIGSEEYLTLTMVLISLIKDSVFFRWVVMEMVFPRMRCLSVYRESFISWIMKLFFQQAGTGSWRAREESIMILCCASLSYNTPWYWKCLIWLSICLSSHCQNVPAPCLKRHRQMRKRLGSRVTLFIEPSTVYSVQNSLVTYQMDAFNVSTTHSFVLHLQRPCWNVNNS